MSEAWVFARPWLLGLLALLPFWALWRAGRRRREAVPFAPLQTVGSKPVGAGRSATPFAWPWVRHLPVPLLESLLLAVLVVGAAGPYRESRVELLEDEGIDIMLVLDVSLSMMADDLPPNRLEALRRVARDFIARAGGHRLGLVVFAADAYVQTPLTGDHGSLLELLDGVTPHAIDQSGGGGTAIGDALLVAAERLVASRVEGRDQSLVLITDGASNRGLEPELGARWMAQQGIRLYAVGVGGDAPVELRFEQRSGTAEPVDDARLQAITDAAGGRYWRATDGDMLEGIFGELSRLESAPLEARTVAVRSSYGDRLAVAALALLTGHLLLGGWLLRRPWR